MYHIRYEKFYFLSYDYNETIFSFLNTMWVNAESVAIPWFRCFNRFSVYLKQQNPLIWFKCTAKVELFSDLYLFSFLVSDAKNTKRLLNHLPEMLEVAHSTCQKKTFFFCLTKIAMASNNNKRFPYSRIK